MKSRVSSNCTRNIHGPSTPENGVNENEVASLVSLSSLKRPMKAKNITNELIDVLFNMIETFRPWFNVDIQFFRASFITDFVCLTTTIINQEHIVWSSTGDPSSSL